MTILSQQDKRWANIYLGSSVLTVGRYGCTTTCISMLSDYFKGFVRPDAIAKVKKNYTKDGLILWNNLELPTMKFEWRQYGFNRAKIDESLKDPNKAVILEVNNGAHWVVATSKTLFGYGSDYNIVDPWLGDRATAIGRYKNITGSAHFTRK